jgi:hypothetical protein
VVEALAAPDPERTLPLDSGQEHVDERRLPQPGLARDEEELANPR